MQLASRHDNIFILPFALLSTSLAKVLRVTTSQEVDATWGEGAHSEAGKKGCLCWPAPLPSHALSVSQDPAQNWRRPVPPREIAGPTGDAKKNREMFRNHC